VSEATKKLDFLEIVKDKLWRCKCLQIKVRTHLLHTVDIQKIELLRKTNFPESKIEKLP